MVVLQDRFRVSQRRPVPLADIEEQKLKQWIRELARRHVRWGRRLVYRRLRLDGWSVNHKRLQRIWREEGLQRPLPRRRKRSRRTGGGRELLRSEYPHHIWAIDFQYDQTMDDRTLKFLNVIDEFSRVCLAIRVGRRCKSVAPSARKVDAFPFRTLFTSRGGSSVSTSDYSGIRSSHLIRLRDFRTIVVRSISANTRCVYRSDCK